MISGTGLGNPVTMLPKYHSFRVPRLGHSALEFVFAVFASVFWGAVWILLVVWHALGALYRMAVDWRD
ncbi:MAG: hypothetical protein KAR40_17040 [Candidatus Sabulitectum sp.]|nr:hypothetical protein [Candidatus Sabulitectum sp.]